MALKCERCGEDIEEIDGFDSMDRGLEYDYDHLCLECWEELEDGEDDYMGRKLD